MPKADPALAIQATLLATMTKIVAPPVVPTAIITMEPAFVTLDTLLAVIAKIVALSAEPTLTTSMEPATVTRGIPSALDHRRRVASTAEPTLTRPMKPVNATRVIPSALDHRRRVAWTADRMRINMDYIALAKLVTNFAPALPVHAVRRLLHRRVIIQLQSLQVLLHPRLLIAWLWLKRCRLLSQWV